MAEPEIPGFLRVFKPLPYERVVNCMVFRGDRLVVATTDGIYISRPEEDDPDGIMTFQKVAHV